MKYNLCKTSEKSRYFIECVKNDIYTYYRTDKCNKVIDAYRIFRRLELGGDLGFESNSGQYYTHVRVDDFKIIFSFNTLEELEKEIVEYLI